MKNVGTRDENDDRSAAIETVAFLARSNARVELLEALADCGECSRDTVRERVDADRTTVTRNLDDLADRGWVARTDRTYALTTAGEAVLADFERLVTTVRTASRLEPFLAWLPDDAFDLDLRHLRDATLTTATEGDPYATVNRHVDAIRTAGEMRLLLPVVGREAAEEGRRRLREDDVAMELVVAEAAADVLQSDPGYASSFEPALEAGMDAFVYGGDLPFHLGIYDDCVQIGVEDDAGVPRALVESRDDAVREWAESTYASYRAAAERIE